MTASWHDRYVLSFGPLVLVVFSPHGHRGAAVCAAAVVARCVESEEVES